MKRALEENKESVLDPTWYRGFISTFANLYLYHKDHEVLEIYLCCLHCHIPLELVMEIIHTFPLLQRGMSAKFMEEHVALHLLKRQHDCSTLVTNLRTLMADVQKLLKAPLGPFVELEVDQSVLMPFKLNDKNPARMYIPKQIYDSHMPVQSIIRVAFSFEDELYDMSITPVGKIIYHAPKKVNIKKSLIILIKYYFRNHYFQLEENSKWYQRQLKWHKDRMIDRLLGLTLSQSEKTLNKFHW